MKKITLLVVFLLTIPTLVLFSQGYDSLRSRAMGGAYTALADDTNTLFLNPAGLGFLNRRELRASLAGGFTATRQLMFGESEFPDVWDSGENGGDYVYWDEFYGYDVYFDPADYGFPWFPDSDDPEGSRDRYREAVEAYMEFQQSYDVFEGMMNVADIGLLPRFMYTGRNWAIGNISNINLDVVPGTFDNNNPDNVPVNVQVRRDGGLIGGLGITLGPLGIGANARLFTRKTDVLSYNLLDFKDGPPATLVENIFASGDGATEVSRLEVGVGGLLALSHWNIGFYAPNLLFFLDDDGLDSEGLFAAMNVGVAYTPSNIKTDNKKSPLNFSLAADLKNIGSETQRSLSAGVEAGLDLFNFLIWNGRMGYRQLLPGSLAGITSGLNLRNGIFSFGFQSKFFIVDLQSSFEFPADMLFDPPSYPLPKEQARDPFATFAFEMSLVF